MEYPDFSSSLGICGSDWPQAAAIVNRAQRRLITCREAGETGWWGSYAEVVFNVTRNNPFITLPRGMARLISLNACDVPIEVNNQFYEYLQFGSGNLPKQCCPSTATVCGMDFVRAFRRNTVCTFADLVPTNKFLRVYTTSSVDAPLRAIIGCRDANGATLRQEDGPLQIQGLAVTLNYPFADVQLPGTTVPIELSAITSVQKDVTLGTVTFFEVDLTTGVQRLLLTMEPSEKIAAYTRYYINSLPRGCCCTPGATDDTNVQVKAIVKLDLIPVVVDSDYLLIQNPEAVMAECQAVRLAGMDTPESKALMAERHKEAVRYLQGELVHYEGKEHPAISFAPFGSAHLRNQKIGQMM